MMLLLVVRQFSGLSDSNSFVMVVMIAAVVWQDDSTVPKGSVTPTFTCAVLKVHEEHAGLSPVPLSCCSTYANYRSTTVAGKEFPSSSNVEKVLC